ncbi:TlpA disulfide reductase family protein [Polaribacter undariae]|uniref:TlpA disulfide reductase family protein n=1 Tax=Polaribacter sejongensis TaxID=985043 RepID=A0AAJ1QXQ5_9FLAO|nr:TlpA disulfide reductase family protein [Polaribacter undariae]MDN3619742.1 TlpA disulfide reductase family protein [Polaribacter undariae]UWD31508.1 TlpA family protein disulfide reductase [Polaribacter undariae]
MFKKIIVLVFVSFLASCSLETPNEFSEKALQEKVYDLNDEVSTFKGVIDQHKGKKILIDVWASWCRDCLVGMPKVKELQKKFPEVVYLFLSVDEKKDSWKRGVKRYDVIGEHYNLPQGMKKGDLVDFLNLSWIPRYVVVDENGKITLFNATDASDENIIKALKE